ncbi:hypothetical protein CKO51_12710 [Rhodopirellula sp. SM50]|nr:hypothetical protein CKO51_12710 [Rhodopirellula sp. SM50]
MNLIHTLFENRRVSPGWAMPMGWFAWFGVMMPVLFELNGWVQNVVMAWAGWLTLWITGCVGTAFIGYDAARNIRRFGCFAIARPRFFFELSRLMVAVAFLLWAPALTFALLLPKINIPLPDVVNIRHLVIVLSVLFCVTAVCGYVTSFLTRRPRCGRAYECTSWFFCIGGGIAMVTFGYTAIPDPPRGIWPAIPGALACCIGMLLLTCGVLSEAMRAERSESSDASELSLRRCPKGKSKFSVR